ncbi:MAG: glycerol-3-phosphate 1-O-acyltransferase PlsY [Clostridia bacterium]|nr:glycerol-3-phosphate 1-O-acyltransferase PlsY [Clostridia bacterium]MDY5555324.1 glycerol-3-phosphate 1-O-acyltransferase PlsY [Blautia sp.]
MERLISVAIGYLFGLFQTAFILGKVYHIDVRQHGSGNLGSTNVLRTLGKKAGAINLVCDCLKCILAIVVVRAIFKRSCPDILPLLSLYAAAGCILGHNFPFYLKFKGGKGIAASLGMLIAFDWKIFLICAVVFLSLFFITHYVSLSSLSAYIAAFISLIAFGQMGYYKMSPSHMMELYVVMGVLTLLAVFEHRNNIKRLLNGTESKIYLKNKKA